MQFVYKERYVKAFRHFPRQAQLRILEADQEIHEYYLTGGASHGLRIKLLHVAGATKVFEARATLAIRIVWVQEANTTVAFTLVGSHDEVKRYLRSLH